MGTPSHTVTNVSSILESLSALQSREAAISTSLADNLSNKASIEDSVDRICFLNPTLDKLREQSVELSQNVSVTANTAQRVGGRVRILDEEMNRVREATDRVHQTMELKSALTSAQLAMEAQDWELATRHCARAMAMPIQVISGPFAEGAIPTSESPLPPIQMLQTARELLLHTFRDNFRLASQARDVSGASRFFKLFPEVGWEDEGLEEYAAFVVNLVHTRPPASSKTTSPAYYITVLTSLFEGVALIIDQHQPIVEKYYGRGKMIAVLIRLIEECDRVIRRLSEGWIEERSAKRKLAQIANFSFTSPGNYRKPSSHTDEDIDMRDIDKLLFELAGMAGRWGLFERFVCDRFKDDPSNNSPKMATQQQQHPEKIPDIFSILETSETKKIMGELLNKYYAPLEVWYLRMTINKVNHLSKPDLTRSPLLTTSPDDVFYILKSVMQRLLSTASTSIIARITAEFREVMTRDYATVIKINLDDVYSSSNVVSGPIRERTERENKSKFITHLNELDISGLHAERLVKDLISTSIVSLSFSDDEIVEIKERTSHLLELVPHFQAIRNTGMEQIFNQLTRPRLRSLIGEMYKDTGYVLDESTYATNEFLEIIQKRFIRNWEIIMDGFKDVFTENNYSIFFSSSVDVFVKSWEKYLCGIRYTELGAIRLDHDIRSILAYLSSQTALASIRDKFQRLHQISTLLNLDTEEDGKEFYQTSGINWRLSLSEAQSIITLRV